MIIPSSERIRVILIRNKCGNGVHVKPRMGEVKRVDVVVVMMMMMVGRARSLLSPPIEDQQL